MELCRYLMPEVADLQAEAPRVQAKKGAYLIGCEVNIAWVEYDVVVCVAGASTKQLPGLHAYTQRA